MVKKLLLICIIICGALLSKTVMIAHASVLIPFNIEGFEYAPDYHNLTTDGSILIPPGSETMYIYAPLIADWYQETITDDYGLVYGSYLIFYDEDETEIVHLIDTDGFEGGSLNTLEIDLLAWGLHEYTLLEMGLLMEFPTYLMETGSHVEFLEFWNENFEVTFDVPPDAIGGGVNVPIAQVAFRHNMMRWYNTIVFDDGSVVIPFSPYRAGESFYGWRFDDFTVYSFDVPLGSHTYPVPPGLFYYLYSTYTPGQAVYEDEIPINDDSRLERIMTSMGLYNRVGFLLVYVTLVIGLTAGLLFLKVSSFAVVLVQTIVTGVFTSMGWLPFYAVIILFMTLIVLIVFTFKKGESK